MYLDEVVDEVARAARVLASAKNVAIEADTAGSAAFVGDEDLIRRLLGNLVDNAVRYAPRGGTVRIELTLTADKYEIAVTDDGPGIPAEIQPRLFERFYRGDAARGRPEADGGAGLGLALARWIANVHGGDVELVRSSAAGTTFRASLASHGSTVVASLAAGR
jgi:signal transduction histidine kinase